MCLPVDDELVADQLGARLERAEVGTRAGLRQAQTPVLLGGQRLAQIALLLFLAAMGQHDRAEHGDVGYGRTGLGHFLVEDGQLHLGFAAAAVLPGPRDAEQSGLVKLALPLDQEFAVSLCARLWRPGPAAILGQIVRNEVADLLAKGFLLCRCK